MEPVASKITAKGQISIPTAVRQQLNLVPGARIEWIERDGEVMVRRASQFSSQDIHDAVFTASPTGAASAADMDDAIRTLLKQKHARG